MMMIFFEYLFHALRYILGFGLVIFFILSWHKLMGPIFEYGLPKWLSKGIDEGKFFPLIFSYFLYLILYMIGVALVIYILDAGFADLWLKIFDFYYFYDYFYKLFN